MNTTKAVNTVRCKCNCKDGIGEILPQEYERLKDALIKGNTIWGCDICNTIFTSDIFRFSLRKHFPYGGCNDFDVHSSWGVPSDSALDYEELLDSINREYTIPKGYKEYDEIRVSDAVRRNPCTL